MFHKPHPRRQQGFAIIAAIFIVVILAAMAAYAVSVNTAHTAGAGMDIQGSRALQAARSGMDWGISRVVNDPTQFGPGNCKAGAPKANLTGSADLPGHAGFTVTVTCTATPYLDGGALISYALMATACSEPDVTGSCPNTGAPGADYVERRVTTQVMCNASGTC
jgi:MSHA biogenesis protein MshP